MMLSFSPLGLNSLLWQDSTDVDLSLHNPVRLQYGYYPNPNYGFWIQARSYTHAAPSTLKTYPSPYFKPEGHLSTQLGVLIGFDFRFMYLHALKLAQKKKSKNSKSNKVQSSTSPSSKGWHTEDRP